jgi:hypothetical protein
MYRKKGKNNLPRKVHVGKESVNGFEVTIQGGLTRAKKKKKKRKEGKLAKRSQKNEKHNRTFIQKAVFGLFIFAEKFLFQKLLLLLLSFPHSSQFFLLSFHPISLFFFFFSFLSTKSIRSA